MGRKQLNYNEALCWRWKICQEKVRDKVDQWACAAGENSSPDLKRVCRRTREQEVRESLCREMWPHNGDQTQTTIHHQRLVDCV